MIRAEKHDAALRALNDILVWARTLAYHKVAHEQLADVLDLAEQLPMLFLRTDDQTDYFRDVLVDLESNYGFAVARQHFDGEM